MTRAETNTETIEPPTQPSAGSPRKRGWTRLELSLTQLIATALAAITATIAASYLGVSGTVIGAALASVVSAVGNAVYGHSLRSTRDRVRVVTRPDRAFPSAGPAAGTAAAVRRENVIDTPPVLPAPRPRRDRSGGNPWRGLAIGSVAVFAAVLAVVTGVEIVAGRPLSDLVRGEAGSGTSVFGTSSTGTGGTRPAPTVTRTVTPSVVITTPTVTQTAPAVTQTATPTETATPSAPPSGSSTPTSGATSSP